MHGNLTANSEEVKVALPPHSLHWAGETSDPLKII